MKILKIPRPILYYLPVIVGFAFILTACNQTSSISEMDNGIYYWRTTLTLSDKEKKFVEDHNIKKMYVRFFDVDRDYETDSHNDVIPNATLLFNDSIPFGIEVIPTVYITTSAIDKMQLNEKEFAEKIYKRIKAICLKNNIEFSEIQLDCDWTKSNRDYFFTLCNEMKNCLDSTQTLSSTIRLHQLTQTPPPVDRGVLMVYNTGNLMDLTTENSIFSAKDIFPYLKDNRLANYNLPLDIAYPVYGWSVIYHPGSDRYYFYKLLKRTDLTDLPSLKKIGDTMYIATEDIKLDNESYFMPDIFKGYKVRVERPSATEILEVKNMIESQLKDKPHNNILYHLDESQLSNYSNNEINKIYSNN